MPPAAPAVPLVPDTLGPLLVEYDRDAAALELPDRAGPSRYFVIKSTSASNLALSIKRAEWIAPPHYGDMIASTLRDGTQVFLVFSVINSQHFQGVARVRAAPVPFDDGGTRRSLIPVEWLRTCALPFTDTVGLRNPAAANTYLATSRDWQEVAAPAGRCLILLLYRNPEIFVDTSGVPLEGTFDVLDISTPGGRAALDTEDHGEAFHRVVPPVPQMQQQQQQQYSGGGGGSFAPPRAGVPRPTAFQLQSAASSLPPLLHLLSLPPGTPSSPATEALLNGAQPPGVVDPITLAADTFVKGRVAYIFGCNNFTGPVNLRSGVFVAPEDHEAKVKNVTVGTPCFLYNVHSKQLFGLFWARTPATLDLIPRGIFPPLTVGPPGQPQRTIEFIWQAQMLCVAEALAMPADIALPMLGGRIAPGPIGPEQAHALAQAMFAALPLPTVLRAVGYLNQIEANGMPSDGLLTAAQGAGPS